MYVGIPPLTGIALFKALEKDGDKFFDKFKNAEPIQRDIDYFRDHIGKVKSAEDLVKDQKLIRFVLRAFDMEGELQSLGRIRKVLQEDTKDERALANRLVDKRFGELAKAFDFANGGADKLGNTSFQQGLVEKYVRQRFEQEIGNQDSAVREARYFIRNAPGVKDAYGLLGDQVLRSVVSETFGLPPQLAIQSLTTQRDTFARLVNIERLTSAESAQSTQESSKTRTQLLAQDKAKLKTEIGRVEESKSTIDALEYLIQDIVFDFGTHAKVTNPATSPYAAEIPVQEAAFKTLIEQQSLISAANQTLSGLGTYMDRLKGLLQKTQDPSTTDFTDIKSQFAKIAAKIKPLLSDPAPGAFETRIDAFIGGTRQNLLDGSFGNLTATVNSAGQSVTVNGYDLLNTEGGSGQFLYELQQAASIVSSASSAGDFGAAITRLNASRSAFNTVNDAVKAEAGYFATAIDSVDEWVIGESSINTAALKQGREQLRDTLNAVTDIDGRVNEIRTKALDIQLLTDPTKRRAAYDEIRGLIEQVTTKASGFSLLSGTGASFDVDNAGGDDIAVSGFDVAAWSTTYLESLPDPADPATPTDAEFQALIKSIDDEFQPRLFNAFSEIKVANQSLALGYDTIDPLGKVYARYDDLVTEIGELASPKNVLQADPLLSRYAAPLTLKLDTTGEKITVSPFTDGGTDATSALVPSYAGAQSVFQTVLDGLALIPSDKAGALQKLEQALFDTKHIGNGLTAIGRDLGFALDRLDPVEPKKAADSLTDGVTYQPLPQSRYTRELMQRFLATNGGQTAAADPNAYLLGLFGGSSLNLKV